MSMQTGFDVSEVAKGLRAESENALCFPFFIRTIIYRRTDCLNADLL